MQPRTFGRSGWTRAGHSGLCARRHADSAAVEGRLAPCPSARAVLPPRIRRGRRFPWTGPSPAVRPMEGAGRSSVVVHLRPGRIPLPSGLYRRPRILTGVLPGRLGPGSRRLSAPSLECGITAGREWGGAFRRRVGPAARGAGAFTSAGASARTLPRRIHCRAHYTGAERASRQASLGGPRPGRGGPNLKEVEAGTVPGLHRGKG